MVKIDGSNVNTGIEVGTDVIEKEKFV